MMRVGQQMGIQRLEQDRIFELLSLNA